MTYEIRRSPASVYPGEVQDECPQAAAEIDVLLRQMARQGPSPVGYSVKNLGQKVGVCGKST